MSNTVSLEEMALAVPLQSWGYDLSLQYYSTYWCTD